MDEIEQRLARIKADLLCELVAVGVFSSYLPQAGLITNLP